MDSDRPFESGSEPTAQDPGGSPSGPDSPRRSKMAIAALVLGILLGPIGVLLGIAAMIRIGANPTRLKGTGLAIGGIIAGTAWCFLAFIALMLVPTFMRTTTGLGDYECEWKVESLSKALMMYCQDWEGDYPPAEKWLGRLSSYDVSQRDLVCPKAKGKLPTYAMNKRIGGMKHRLVKYPEDTVLLFESVPGDNPAGGPELFPKDPRHKGGYVVAFADGNVRTVEKSWLGKLNFDPSPASKPKGLPPEPSG